MCGRIEGPDKVWRMSDQEVRTAVYRTFIETGEAPTVDDLSQMFGWSATEIEAALRRLASDHEIVLHPGTTDLWMAHPFSAIPTDYRVDSADGRSFWANCAWDGLAIPGLVGASTVTTRSAATGEFFQVEVRDGRVTPDHLVRFGVPARDFWVDIGYT